MGRQDWENSLMVDRAKIERARMDASASSWVDRERIERFNDNVDKTLREDLNVPWDFLDGQLERHCIRRHYLTRGNNILVRPSQDADREQRLGVSISFNRAEWYPSPAALALLLSHCNDSHPHKDGLDRACVSLQPEKRDAGGISTDRDQNRCICALLSEYSDKEWNRARPLRLWPFPCFKRQDLFKDREPVTMQFMFRYATLSDGKAGPEWPQALRNIPSFRHGTENIQMEAKSIIERRHLLFMKYFPGDSASRTDTSPPYHFTLISLGPLQHKESHDSIRKMQSDAAKSAGDLMPFVLFIRDLRLLFLQYSEEWYEILAHVEQGISFKLSEIEDYSKGTQNYSMMYDNDSQSTSTAYFKLFQVLRTLDGMVKETLVDFRDWHFKVVKTLEGPSHTFEQDQLQAVIHEWKDLTGRLEARLGEIRQRIAEKRADVQSLSDNMFNATSIKEARAAIKEASKSVALNRLVTVFTVVTVVYTPMGFVTALFGMNNIHDGSVLSSSWAPFGYILTTVCLTTYMVAFVSIWWLGWIKLGQGLPDYFKGLSGKMTRGTGLEPDTTNAARRNVEEGSDFMDPGTRYHDDKRDPGSHLV